MEISSSSELDLTCLIPCLNESTTIGDCVKKANDSILKLGIKGEVIVADNGSTDGSIEIAIKNGSKVLNVPIRGYGSALISGINSAKGKYTIMGDADGTYEWDKIQKIYNKLSQGNDLVMGNRFENKIINGAMPFLSKYIGNPVLSFLGRLFFKIKIRDFHCGLRGFNTSKIKDLNLNSLGMEFASEIVIKSALSNYKIVEVPINLLPGPKNRKPHLRPFRDGWRHLRLLLAYSPTWSSIIPGTIFLSIGLGLFYIIYSLEGRFINLTLKEHSLVTATGFIAFGFSAITLGFLGIFSLSEYVRFSNSIIVRKFKSNKSLELLLVFGTIVLLIGFYLIYRSFWQWQKVNFNNLQTSSLIYQISPGVLLLLIGANLIFSGFLFETIKQNLKFKF